GSRKPAGKDSGRAERHRERRADAATTSRSKVSGASMFETFSIVVVTLRQLRRIKTATTREALLPPLTTSNGASPKWWAQKWAHAISDAANCSEISTFRGRPSLPWAQGAAGSNPAARTTLRRICRSHIGHTRIGAEPRAKCDLQTSTPAATSLGNQA